MQKYEHGLEIQSLVHVEHGDALVQTSLRRNTFTAYFSDHLFVAAL